MSGLNVLVWVPTVGQLRQEDKFPEYSQLGIVFETSWGCGRPRLKYKNKANRKDIHLHQPSETFRIVASVFRPQELNMCRACSYSMCWGSLLWPLSEVNSAIAYRINTSLCSYFFLFLFLIIFLIFESLEAPKDTREPCLGDCGDPGAVLIWVGRLSVDGSFFRKMLAVPFLWFLLKGEGMGSLSKDSIQKENCCKKYPVLSAKRKGEMRRTGSVSLWSAISEWASSGLKSN